MFFKKMILVFSAIFGLFLAPAVFSFKGVLINTTNNIVKMNFNDDKIHGVVLNPGEENTVEFGMKPYTKDILASRKAIELFQTPFISSISFLEMPSLHELESKKLIRNKNFNKEIWFKIRSSTLDISMIKVNAWANAGTTVTFKIKSSTFCSCSYCSSRVVGYEAWFLPEAVFPPAKLLKSPESITLSHDTIEIDLKEPQPCGADYDSE